MVLIAVFFFEHRSKEALAIQVSRNEIPATNVSDETPVPENRDEGLASITAAPRTSPARSASASTNSVEERISELEELGARNDSESFQKIVADLRDTNPEIRQAALDAIMQFGNRDAVPILKELSAKTEDAREKVALLDAAEFLDLPSLSEIRQTRLTNSTSTRTNRQRK